jgi:hypothetical protein
MREKAISEGIMYDLVFANFGNPRFNSHEQFAYFRKHENDLLLCIVNFQDKPAEIELAIPAEAFQFLKIKEGEYYSAKNLLDENAVFPIQKLSSEYKYKVHIPAWDGKILKLEKVLVI